MRGVVAVAAPALLLAACNNTPEGRAERAAAQMNALNNKVLDRAYAEGNTLVVRYKAINTRQFSDSELMKLTTAGLCTLDKVKDLLADGAAIRMEIPRGGTYLKIGVTGCEGERAVLAKQEGSSDWPTGAPIQQN
jgi:hypothetical protein